ncbi:MAG: rhodanese-like domain-containing protein [Pseudodesulfovibrio sp.]
MHKRLFAIAMMLVFAVTAMAGVAMAAEGKAKPKFKEFHSVVDYKFVAKYAKMPKAKNAMIVDSRPYKPKYIAGYIPTAVSIPTSQFDKMTDKLPANKNDVVIFYCGGFS